MFELDGGGGCRGREGLLVDNDGYFTVSVLTLGRCGLGRERSALVKCSGRIICSQFVKNRVYS